MRWKIGSRGRDPRQIDLIVILALLIVLAAELFQAHQNLGIFSANPL